MKIDLRNIAYFLLLTILIISCSNDQHLIQDVNFRRTIHKQFIESIAMSAELERNVNALFNQNLNLEEKEALEFLYAAMPLCDMADYSPDFILKQVHYALKSKHFFSWSKQVPDTIFLHYVLPYRINNENLDTARVYFFKHLKSRIQGMDIEEAISEVNYWCREHVTYKGTDIRTSAPLSTLKTAYGRCGEESTFLVSALRSVAIPARQVYVPRWAHCDDNHAWVEVWMNGEWYFLGACEPVPGLNQGWFAGPAKRAMLVHTKSFGLHQFKAENPLKETNWYTELNVLENYASTRKYSVLVKDQDQNRIKEALVQFGLYNYAEFYPLQEIKADSNGIASFTSGFGDLLVSSSQDNNFGFVQTQGNSADTIELILDKKVGEELELSMLLHAPKDAAQLNTDTTGTWICKKRTEQADAIRNNYEQSLFEEKHFEELILASEEYELNKNRLKNLLVASRGNFKTLSDFLLSTGIKAPEIALDLLENLSEKDLRDVEPAVLSDHFIHTLPKDPGIEPMVYHRYVLSPRIRNEKLSTYKGFFIEHIGRSKLNAFKKNPIELIRWVNSRIRLNNERQYYDLPITPIGVYKIKQANEQSKAIFTLALFRTINIPARINPIYDRPEVYINSQWQSIDFEHEKIYIPQKSTLNIAHGNSKDSWNYYTDFCLAKFDNGFFKSIDDPLEGSSWKASETIELLPGYYRIITGNRSKNGDVRAHIQFIDLKPDEHQKVILEQIPFQNIDNNTLEIFPNLHLLNVKTGQALSLYNADSDKKIVICYLSNEEPDKHLLAELENLEPGNAPFDLKLIFDSRTSFNTLLQAYPFIKTLDCYFVAPDEKSDLSHWFHKAGPNCYVMNQKHHLEFAHSGYKIGLANELFSFVSETQCLK